MFGDEEIAGAQSKKIITFKCVCLYTSGAILMFLPPVLGASLISILGGRVQLISWKLLLGYLNTAEH